MIKNHSYSDPIPILDLLRLLLTPDPAQCTSVTHKTCLRLILVPLQNVVNC